MPITKQELKEKYHTKYTDLSDFAADARLLQSIWREENDIPMNIMKTFSYFEDGKDTGEKVFLGNYIDPVFANSNYSNFLTDNIKRIVKAELCENKFRKGKDKKVLKKDRLRENMLSSQPLAFNLFGELSNELATNVFKSLFGDIVLEITGIEFEYSPGRRNPEYLNDNSAFDVFFEYIGHKGKGFIGIEVKYVEILNDQPATSENKEYKSTAIKSNLFTEEGIEFLDKMPRSIEQIWRDHLLSLSLLYHKDRKYNEGFFIYLFPKRNERCSFFLNEYFKNLKSPNFEDNGFYPLEMENLVDVIKQNTPEDWINIFYDRYLNFDKINQYLNK